MRFSGLLADEAVLEELGRRLAAARVALGKTQAQLAGDAGVSKRTVERLEDGASVQLGNLVRCLRALGRLDALEALLPEPHANPLDLLSRDRPRARARPSPGVTEGEPWAWGDSDEGGAS